MISFALRCCSLIAAFVYQARGTMHDANVLVQNFGPTDRLIKPVLGVAKAGANVLIHSPMVQRVAVQGARNTRAVMNTGQRIFMQETKKYGKHHAKAGQETFQSFTEDVINGDIRDPKTYALQYLVTYSAARMHLLRKEHLKDNKVADKFAEKFIKSAKKDIIEHLREKKVGQNEHPDYYTYQNLRNPDHFTNPDYYTYQNLGNPDHFTNPNFGNLRNPGHFTNHNHEHPEYPDHYTNQHHGIRGNLPGGGIADTKALPQLNTQVSMSDIKEMEALLLIPPEKQIVKIDDSNIHLKYADVCGKEKYRSLDTGVDYIENEEWQQFFRLRGATIAEFYSRESDHLTLSQWSLDISLSENGGPTTIGEMLAPCGHWDLISIYTQNNYFDDDKEAENTLLECMWRDCTELSDGKWHRGTHLPAAELLAIKLWAEEKGMLKKCHHSILCAGDYDGYDQEMSNKEIMCSIWRLQKVDGGDGGSYGGIDLILDPTLKDFHQNEVPVDEYYDVAWHEDEGYNCDMVFPAQTQEVKVTEDLKDAEIDLTDFPNFVKEDKEAMDKFVKDMETTWKGKKGGDKHTFLGLVNLPQYDMRFFTWELCDGLPRSMSSPPSPGWVKRV